MLAPLDMKTWAGLNLHSSRMWARTYENVSGFKDLHSSRMSNDQRNIYILFLKFMYEKEEPTKVEEEKEEETVELDEEEEVKEEKEEYG